MQKLDLNGLVDFVPPFSQAVSLFDWRDGILAIFQGFGSAGEGPIYIRGGDNLNGERYRI
jgi:hypothetical protein